MTFSETSAVLSIAITIMGSTGVAVFLIGRWMGAVTAQITALGTALEAHADGTSTHLRDHSRRIGRLEETLMEPRDAG